MSSFGRHTRSRWNLWRQLCEEWGWEQANGAVRDVVCRGLLLMLERAGQIEFTASALADPGPVPSVDLPKRQCRVEACGSEWTPPRPFAQGSERPGLPAVGCVLLGVKNNGLERARCHGNAVINGAPRHDAVFSDASLSAVRSAEIVATRCFQSTLDRQTR